MQQMLKLYLTEEETSVWKANWHMLMQTAANLKQNRSSWCLETHFSDCRVSHLTPDSMTHSWIHQYTSLRPYLIPSPTGTAHPVLPSQDKTHSDHNRVIFYKLKTRYFFWALDNMFTIHWQSDANCRTDSPYKNANFFQNEVQKWTRLYDDMHWWFIIGTLK